MSSENRYVPSVQQDGLRHWQVAGGIIVSGDSVLLVKNLRRGGAVDWSTPGGVVDPGETPLEGLTREVEEETGLTVERWRGPLYRVEVTAPDAGFLLRVEAHLAVDVVGTVVVDDPDGIVVGVDYVARAEVASRLVEAQPWVAEPLLAHLEDGIDDGRVFRYHMTGARGDDRQIERL
jgi:8-oxo-dGTP diphosphatase